MARTHKQILEDAAASGNTNAQDILGGGSRPKFDPIKGIGEFLRGDDWPDSPGAKPKPSEMIPDAPNLSEDPTGIGYTPGPGENIPQTVTELHQGAVDAAELKAQREFGANIADQRRGEELSDKVHGDIGDIEGKIDEASTDLQKSEQRFQENLEGAKQNLEEIPGKITDEFTQLRSEFGEAADASFDRIDSQRTDALANAERGQSAALQAAVQGIQGNVNTQVAQIMSNPNLTQAQKQSMVSQVKLTGASSMAPAIGATVLQFNQLSADISTKFGAITGTLEGIALQGEGQLIGMQGNAFSQAQIEVGKMTNQLLEIDANASIGFANSQNQLLATRSHATLSGNRLLLDILPEQSTPYLDLTEAATMAAEFGKDLMLSQWEIDAQEAGMDIQIMGIEAMEGTPLEKLFEYGLAFLG